MYRQQRTGSGADRKIKYLTVLAVTVLFVLILVLVTVLIQKSQLESRREALMEQIEYYRQLQETQRDELAKRETYEWLEQQARELGLIDGDETLFSPGA